MAGLLKAIENGYKPTPREIVEELWGIPREVGVTEFGSAVNGASSHEEFIKKLFNLLGVQL